MTVFIRRPTVKICPVHKLSATSMMMSIKRQNQIVSGIKRRFLSVAKQAGHWGGPKRWFVP